MASDGEGDVKETQVELLETRKTSSKINKKRYHGSERRIDDAAGSDYRLHGRARGKAQKMKRGTGLSCLYRKRGELKGERENKNGSIGKWNI